MTISGGDKFFGWGCLANTVILKFVFPMTKDVSFTAWNRRRKKTVWVAITTS